MAKRRQKTMKVRILQRGGSTLHHDIIEEGARFFAKELMSTRLTNTLTIDIALRVGGRKKKSTQGHVEMMFNGAIQQKNFKINIDRDMTLPDQLEVLAHEMIHVEQIARGRFQSRKWKSDGIFHARWEGKDLGDHTKIPYRQQPWEIEAFANQKALSKKFFDEVLEPRAIQTLMAQVRSQAA